MATPLSRDSCLVRILVAFSASSVIKKGAQSNTTARDALPLNHTEQQQQAMPWLTPTGWWEVGCAVRSGLGFSVLCFSVCFSDSWWLSHVPFGAGSLGSSSPASDAFILGVFLLTSKITAFLINTTQCVGVLAKGKLALAFFRGVEGDRGRYKPGSCISAPGKLIKWKKKGNTAIKQLENQDKMRSK